MNYREPDEVINGYCTYSNIQRCLFPEYDIIIISGKPKKLLHISCSCRTNCAVINHNIMVYYEVASMGIIVKAHFDIISIANII